MRRILIAEDNAVNRELLRELLEARGYTVLEACDGQEALHMIEHCSTPATAAGHRHASIGWIRGRTQNPQESALSATGGSGSYCLCYGR